MGSLKSGATYTYEHQDGVVSATESGIQKAVGWEYDPRTDDGRPLRDHLMDNKLWGNIRRAAKDNIALQKALDQCIILYHLSKDNGK